MISRPANNQPFQQKTRIHCCRVASRLILHDSIVRILDCWSIFIAFSEINAVCLVYAQTIFQEDACQFVADFRHAHVISKTSFHSTTTLNCVAHTTVSLVYMSLSV